MGSDIANVVCQHSIKIVISHIQTTGLELIVIYSGPISLTAETGPSRHLIGARLFNFKRGRDYGEKNTFTIFNISDLYYVVF